MIRNVLLLRRRGVHSHTVWRTDICNFRSRGPDSFGLYVHLHRVNTGTRACVHTYTHRYTHTYTHTQDWEGESCPCLMILGYILRKAIFFRKYSELQHKNHLIPNPGQRLGQVILPVFFEQLMCDQNEGSRGWCRCWVIVTHLEYLSVNANCKCKYSVIPRCMAITQHMHTRPAVSY